MLYYIVIVLLLLLLEKMNKLYAFDVCYTDNKTNYYLHEYFDTEEYEYYGNGEDNRNKTIYIPLKDFKPDTFEDLILNYFTDIFIEYICNKKTITKSDVNKKIMKEYIKKNVVVFDIDRIFYYELLHDKKKINYAYRYIRLLFNVNSIINTKGIRSFDDEIIQLFSN